MSRGERTLLKWVLGLAAILAAAAVTGGIANYNLTGRIEASMAEFKTAIRNRMDRFEVSVANRMDRMEDKMDRLIERQNGNTKENEK